MEKFGAIMQQLTAAVPIGGPHATNTSHNLNDGHIGPIGNAEGDMA